MNTALSVDPALNPSALRGAFQRFGRLHLPGFLAGDGAARVHEALMGPVRWHKHLNYGGKIYVPSLAQYEAITPDERRALEAALRVSARDDFAFRYDAWNVSDFVEAAMRSGSAIEAVYDLLNSQKFLTFVGALTGEARAVYCDAQATRYRPGDFLTRHDDLVESKHRLLAYVLNMTPVWKVDWGGLLLFHDADGHVAEGYTPSFNALNIFKVPQLHSVSAVADFAGADRLAITGWIRAQAPSR